MGGLTIFGTCLMGAVLIAGQYLFPENIIMWFAAGTPTMAIWRPVILVGLVLLAFIQSYYDSVYWRLVWGVVTLVLLVHAGDYFMDHPEYVFDAMFMVGAGVCFLVATILPAPDPLRLPRYLEALLPSMATVYYVFLHKPRLHVLHPWHGHSYEAKELGHRLMLQRGPQLLKQ